MNKDSSVFIAGHGELVGSAIYRLLLKKGHTNLITVARDALDLLDQKAVDGFFKANRVDYVFLAAEKSGGIHANRSYPADFLYQNLMIATNVIHAGFRHDIKKLLFFGSSCAYPGLTSQPISEESLLTGSLEPTSEPYSIAKIAGMKLCEAYMRQFAKCFISAVPANLYGPFDMFDSEDSHVIPALIRRFHEAKQQGASCVPVWGSGLAKRDFLYVDDLAEASYLLMLHYDKTEPINVSSSVGYSICEVANTIKKIVGFQGDITFDASKPDGSPCKLLDGRKMQKLGWQPAHSLEEGILKTYQWAKRAAIL